MPAGKVHACRRQCSKSLTRCSICRSLTLKIIDRAQAQDLRQLIQRLINLAQQLRVRQIAGMQPVAIVFSTHAVSC